MKKVNSVCGIALRGIGLAMGIAVVVLSILDSIEIQSAITMLGIGLMCLSLSVFNQKKQMNQKVIFTEQEQEKLQKQNDDYTVIDTRML